VPALQVVPLQHDWLSPPQVRHTPETQP
jgi:hypothetical protein